MMLLSLLGQAFYNGVTTYFNMENKKVRELKRHIIVIDDFEIEIVHFFGKNKKLHCFGLRFNLKQNKILSFIVTI